MKRALVVVALLAEPAIAQDATLTNPAKVVALVAGDDVLHATLVGPSGQIYEPDGKGAWARHAAGGVAADVSGAARADGELIVTGHSSPMYRDHEGVWFTVEVGADGHTVMGTGPAFAVAVGKDVFTRGKKGWTRAATVPGKITAVWSDGKQTWAATDAALYRIRNKDAAKAGDAPRALAGGTAWGIGDKTLTPLGGGKAVPATLDGTAVTVVAAGGAPGDASLTVVADNGGHLVLAHTHKGALEKIDDVPGTGPVAALAVDPAGTALVAFADGTIAVHAAGAWTTAQVTDALPAAKPGPGPSRAE